MKKLFALLLCLATVLCFFGCTREDTDSTATTEPKQDDSPWAGIVNDPQTWYNELMALPIANENMTEDQLRQLCVDAMHFHMTFPWTPNREIRYSFHDRYTGATTEVFLPTGIAYSGMFYCNNNARGNIWKALEYYDPQTGVMDIAAMDGNFLDVLSSACARACEWGWSRVCNNTGLQTMESYSMYHSNIVPVGPYTYGLGKYSFTDRSGGTKDIIRDNGEQVMLASYALLKPADGIYSSSSYHVEMVAQAPMIVYNKDGSIDPEKSYLLTMGQGAIGTTGDSKNYFQENGVTMRPLGTVDKKYTFRELLDKGYIPFTLKELCGQAPVETGDAWIGTPSSRLENGTVMTLEEILSKTLFTNYAVCTVEAQIKSPDGDVLVRHKYGYSSTPFTYHAFINSREFENRAIPYANGENTVHIYVRMANGERIEAFCTVLKVA